MEYVCDSCANRLRDMGEGKYVVCRKRDTRRKVEKSDRFSCEQMCLDFERVRGLDVGFL